MKKFTLMQRVRNRIKIRDKSVSLEIASSAKIVNCNISIKGENNRLIIEDGVIIRDASLELVGNDCSLYIGKDSMIGRDSYLSVKEGKQLSIGAKTGLSRNVKVMTSDGHPIYMDGVRINEAKDITMGSGVWVADNVTILKGVQIGSGSVIGINATVTKNIPNNVIAVGNPAKVVKENISWEDKI